MFGPVAMLSGAADAMRRGCERGPPKRTPFDGSPGRRRETSYGVGRCVVVVAVQAPVASHVPGTPPEAVQALPRGAIV